ncbi:queuosine precursor transporter [candidate division KSB1 bacterium]|nr:queuosine precursor transporter [candidate division KSB1 bacterium]
MSPLPPYHIPSQVPQGLRYYDIVAGLFVAVLLVSNISATKLVELWGFPFDAGTILFPLSYIFGDILTEVYGYGRARRVIWLGFLANALAAITFGIVAKLPPAGIWDGQAAFEAILGVVPRIVAASFIAYLCGEFINSYVLARLKIATRGRWLWTRTISSTLAGEAVDTLLFVVIAFGGTIPAADLWLMIAFNYMFKCGTEILFTPVTYVVVGFLKRYERVDVFDIGTSFNPFLFFRAAPRTA